MDKITSIRVSLGLEKKSCSNCRWKMSGGVEIKKKNGESTFCRQPAWLKYMKYKGTSDDYKRVCGAEGNQDSGMMDWEPRSPRQVPIGDDE